MNDERKAVTLQALRNFRGNDLYRAKCAFRGFTPEQMDQPHGESGKTRSQILAEYQSHEDKVDRAIAWVEGL